MLIRLAFLTCAGALGAQPVSAAALKTLEGLWGKSFAECRDREGPNENMLIGRDKIDLYETHCIVAYELEERGDLLLDVACAQEGTAITGQIILRKRTAGTLVAAFRLGKDPKTHQTSYLRCPKR